MPKPPSNSTTSGSTSSVPTAKAKGKAKAKAASGHSSAEPGGNFSAQPPSSGQPSEAGSTPLIVMPEVLHMMQTEDSEWENEL